MLALARADGVAEMCRPRWSPPLSLFDIGNLVAIPAFVLSTLVPVLPDLRDARAASWRLPSPMIYIEINRRLFTKNQHGVRTRSHE